MEKIVLVKSDIGKNLKRIRKKAGLSQTDMAKRIHVRRETISRWERQLHFPNCICEMKLQEVLNNLETLIGMSNKF